MFGVFGYIATQVSAANALAVRSTGVKPSIIQTYIVVK